jgi:3-isopropylmalate dehydrogenase
MPTDQSLRIVVLPGDGIGIEVMDAALAVLEPLVRRVGGFALAFETHPGGAHHYQATGDALPDASMKASAAADAILFGAMGWPDIRYPDGTEIAPQLDLRLALELFAGVRPIRQLPGLPPMLADPRAREIDFVIVRESTEGWFNARGRGDVRGDTEVFDTGRITRAGCERLFDFSFRLAERRRARNPQKGRVTCVDKSNVFAGMAFMNKIFWERAKHYPNVPADHCYIDAMALNLIRKPWAYDVMPMENQFGDIISDLGAGLIGGMGFAPSGDIGLEHAVFQPSHGSAPDIAGKGLANPTAMILSAAMMLDWLAQRHDAARLADAATLLEAAVDRVFAERRVTTPEFGGTDGTAAVTKAVIAAIGEPATARARS